ncbi:MAG: outer membrane beta-barrel protein [Pseudomonadota bacterium]
MTNGKYCYFIVIALSFILVVPSVRADEFRLVPSIAAREEYNSNIFLSTVDQKRDFVTTLSPGIEIVKRDERLDTGAQIRVDRVEYTDNRDLNATDQTYKGNIRYRFTPNFSFAANAGYLVDSQPDRDLQTTGLVMSALQRERVNTSLSTDYQITEITALSMSYAYSKDTYEKKFFDTLSHQVNAGLTQDFSKYFPAVKGMLNFGYSSYDIAGFRTNSIMGTMGISRNFSEIWAINVSGGARYTETEFPVLRLQQAAQDKQTDEGWGWVGQVSLTYKGERSNGHLTYSRDVSPASGEGTAVERNALMIGGRYRLTYELSFLLNAGYYTNKSGQFASSANAIDSQSFIINPRLRYEFSKDVALEASYDYYKVDDRAADTQAERHRVSLYLSVQHAFLE